jgi:hypothetical protein
MSPTNDLARELGEQLTAQSWRRKAAPAWNEEERRIVERIRQKAQRGDREAKRQLEEHQQWQSSHELKVEWVPERRSVRVLHNAMVLHESVVEEWEPGQPPPYALVPTILRNGDMLFYRYFGLDDHAI